MTLGAGSLLCEGDEWESLTLTEILSRAQTLWPDIAVGDVVVTPRYVCVYDGDDTRPYLEVRTNDTYLDRRKEPVGVDTEVKDDAKVPVLRNTASLKLYRIVNNDYDRHTRNQRCFTATDIENGSGEMRFENGSGSFNAFVVVATSEERARALILRYVEKRDQKDYWNDKTEVCTMIGTPVAELPEAILVDGYWYDNYDD